MLLTTFPDVEGRGVKEYLGGITYSVRWDTWADAGNTGRAEFEQHAAAEGADAVVDVNIHVCGVGNGAISATWVRMAVKLFPGGGPAFSTS